MANHPQSLLEQVEAFLSETGMGHSYFGRKAVGNSELVRRLRDGRRVWPETADRVRAYMAFHRLSADADIRGAASRARQASPREGAAQ